ncbi:hypothetical protein CCHR01_16298 [Colletotrichum chrysophilum]|uniref:Uncharacterized protein n=1 Tax=Colletotrichum chrysophilum TaxID=1836956 RepID=A0AAD9A4P0_9PEZI|nr:hypothetical protein CCHR01_16298 [Colletotrichum chrysophilum]
MLPTSPAGTSEEHFRYFPNRRHIFPASSSQGARLRFIHNWAPGFGPQPLELGQSISLPLAGRGIAERKDQKRCGSPGKTGGYFDLCSTPLTQALPPSEPWAPDPSFEPGPYYQVVKGPRSVGATTMRAEASPPTTHGSSAARAIDVRILWSLESQACSLGMFANVFNRSSWAYVSYQDQTRRRRMVWGPCPQKVGRSLEDTDLGFPASYRPVRRGVVLSGPPNGLASWLKHRRVARKRKHARVGFQHLGNGTRTHLPPKLSSFQQSFWPGTYVPHGVADTYASLSWAFTLHQRTQQKRVAFITPGPNILAASGRATPQLLRT